MMIDEIKLGPAVSAPMTFRIMPKQAPFPKETGLRWGFMIENHPLGDPATGYYIASWSTFDEAVAAALCLGISPLNVGSVTCFIPDRAP
jgi:hypothetical protein